MITQTERTSSRQDHERKRQLEERLRQFDRWALSADRSNSDWETDFPHWSELIHAAMEAMAREPENVSLLPLLERCWSLSNEGEECADWARQHLGSATVRQLVERLTGSVDGAVRWQAYDVLGDLPTLDADAQALLENGLTDEDAYVRRRVFLALRRHGEIELRPYFARMLADADAYNRYVAVKEAQKDNDPALLPLVQAASQDAEVAALLADYESRKELMDQFVQYE